MITKENRLFSFKSKQFFFISFVSNCRLWFKTNFFCRAGEIQRKQNIQGPIVVQQNDGKHRDEQQSAAVKEDFINATNSQSTDSLNTDPFNQNSEIVENQIHNMTREAGDGQNDTGTENVE